MGKTENAPAGEQLAAVQSQLWASHIILSPLNMSQPTEQQIVDYEGYAALQTDYGVTAAKLSVTEDKFSNWGFSFNLNADTDTAVVRQSVSAMTESLELAGVGIGELEFIAVHVATIKALKESTEARRAVDPYLPAARISDEYYAGTDNQRFHARNGFYTVRNRVLAVTCFDNSEALVAQARQTMARAS